MSSKVIIPIFIYILFIIIAITFVIGIFYFDWFSNGNRTNSYNKIAENIETFKESSDEQKDAGTELEQKTIEDSKEESFKNEREGSVQLYTNKDYAETRKGDSTIYYTNNKKSGEKIYGKGSSVPDASFDAQGEYVSEEEHQYRLALIQNLTIKSVVIDKLTKGNGVSQEFFKVIYKEKMIPAKILEEIVESKEFRELIPAKYRNLEDKTAGLKKGEKVVFNNKSIRQLLILWSLGRLTPVQKAWKVKAEN